VGVKMAINLKDPKLYSKFCECKDQSLLKNLAGHEIGAMPKQIDVQIRIALLWIVDTLKLQRS
jgi:hypothetical protein